MSLKAFHIIFITLSISLCFGYGYWSFIQPNENGNLFWGALSIFLGIGLMVYGFFFLQKMKKFCLSILLLNLIWINHAQACSVCFGDPQSSLTIGLKMGILTLLVVLFGVLGSFAYFFLQLKKREQLFNV